MLVLNGIFFLISELEIRLHGGDTQYKGMVEIKLNGTWGTICDDSWGIEEANVICRMLNFTEGALSTQCCGFYNRYGIAERIWLDDVHCVGDEQSILSIFWLLTKGAYHFSERR